MEKRRLGRTDHMSSIVTFGCYALSKIPQEEADQVIQMALEYGINHFDVAPSYGEAELRLRPWLQKRRNEIFLACKTLRRKKEEAKEDLYRSMERLGVRQIDLYQIHALDNPEDVEIVMSSNGALETIKEARENGLIKYIGITSHRPPTLLKALERFDFDTIMFPLNFVLRKHRCRENDYEPLLKIAEERDMGMIAIKAFAKRPWEGEKRHYQTWYEPFDKPEEIELCLRFALSQGVTTVATPGDPNLVPLILKAAEKFRELTKVEQQELVESASNLVPIFPRKR
jgi:aryl-alcohol dehydrogenase-like predicted oxidoreductase